VNFIFVLVVVAMLALLVIQSFQTAQLYDRKSTQFKSKVVTSLERIALRHEKAEDIRRYMQIVNRDFSGQYKDILKEEFKSLLATQETTSIRDTSILENGVFQDYLVIKGTSFDSISGLTAEHKVLARDVKHMRDLVDHPSKKIMDNDSIGNKVSLQLDQRVLNQIFMKSKLINDMMIEAFRYNDGDHPETRIDIEFLDSIIKYEMKIDKLPSDYKFMISNKEGLPICFNFNNKRTPKHCKIKRYCSQVDTVKSSKTLLFPSNILDDDLTLHLFFPTKSSYLLKEMWGSMSISLVLMILIVVALVFMFKTILSQKKLSELRSDFISNMTHEFKTPISTISLACQALNDADMNSSTTSDEKLYVKVIDDENKRLGLLVESILQSAVMDKGELQLNIQTVNLFELLNDVIEKVKFRLKSTNGEIELINDIDKNVQIRCDRMHVSNIITNLIDNATKYCHEVPKITVRLSKTDEVIRLSIEDNGIGIAKEHISKIFDKLYRVPTGNIHNVKGFGLGLSYVRVVSDLHKWNLNVKSVLGKGSTFTIIIK